MGRDSMFQEDVQEEQLSELRGHDGIVCSELGMRTRRDREMKDRDTGSILDGYQTKELETRI